MPASWLDTKSTKIRTPCGKYLCYMSATVGESFGCHTASYRYFHLNMHDLNGSHLPGIYDYKIYTMPNGVTEAELESIVPQIYDSLYRSIINTTPMYIFSDRVKYKNGKAWNANNDTLAKFTLDAWIRWVVANKGGTLSASHVTQNPQHSTSSDFSMTRVYTYTPPSVSHLAVRDSAYTKYDPAVVTAPAWKARALTTYGEWINNLFTDKELQEL